MTGRIVSTNDGGGGGGGFHRGRSTGQHDFAIRLRQQHLRLARTWKIHRRWPKTIGSEYASLSDSVGCQPNKGLAAALKNLCGKVIYGLLWRCSRVVISVGVFMFSVCVVLSVCVCVQGVHTFNDVFNISGSFCGCVVHWLVSQLLNRHGWY